MGDFYKNKRRDKLYQYPHCKKCHIQLMVERGIKSKMKAIEYLGGKCIKCGYHRSVDALEFHHRDGLKKDKAISRMATMSFEKIKNELDNCDLLCCRCHRELHNPQCNL